MNEVGYGKLIANHSPSLTGFQQNLIKVKGRDALRSNSIKMANGSMPTVDPIITSYVKSERLGLQRE